MDTVQLMGIAEQLGIKVSPDDELETVVYSILDKAAEESAMNSTAAPKRKRTRIVKKIRTRFTLSTARTAKTST